MQHIEQGQGIRIATSFVSSYYSLLVTNAVELVKYYAKDSHFTVVEGPEDLPGKILTGPEQILEKVQSLNLFGNKIQLQSLNWQPSVSGSVLIVVDGSIAPSHRNFTQTFVLAKSLHKEKSFYVSNDCLRFLDTSFPAAPVAAQPEQHRVIDAHLARAQQQQEPLLQAAVAQPHHDEFSSWKEEEVTPARATTAWGTPAVLKPKAAEPRAVQPDFAQYQPAAPAPVAPVAPAAPVVPIAQAPAVVAAPVVAPVAPTPAPTPAESVWNTSSTVAEAAQPVWGTTDASASSGLSFADVLRRNAGRSDQPRQPTTVVTSPAPAPQKPRVGGRGAAPAAPAAPQRGAGRAGGAGGAPQGDKPSVFIGGLPADYTDQELNEALSQFCTVAQIRRGKGNFAFVDLANVQSQQKALEASQRGEILIRNQAVRVETQTGKKPAKPSSPTNKGAPKKN